MIPLNKTSGVKDFKNNQQDVFRNTIPNNIRENVYLNFKPDFKKEIKLPITLGKIFSSSWRFIVYASLIAQQYLVNQFVLIQLSLLYRHNLINANLY